VMGVLESIALGYIGAFVAIQVLGVILSAF
jgi:uncharacterized membrane protein YeaQ/YmgE (transglycosylase-associated protein family)